MLLARQVFGKLLEPESEAESMTGDEGRWDGTDLKQHVVGILFSR
jgi:hypothetical protein